jgi:hypothetical protein
MEIRMKCFRNSVEIVFSLYFNSRKLSLPRRTPCQEKAYSSFSKNELEKNGNLSRFHIK